jgi:hypothetical protein
MSSTEWTQWEAATSVADLAQLTALWLEGVLPSQPGYQPRCGPDPETEPLIPVLAAACRAGYLTDGSQPGSALGRGYDGALWTQRAAVTGWIDTHLVDQLAGMAEDAGLVVITHTVRRHWWSRREHGWVDVTRRAGRVCTGFGGQHTRNALRWQYAECGPAAIDAVLGSVQLTIAAPEYGPSEQVWRVLARWAANRVTRTEASA